VGNLGLKTILDNHAQASEKGDPSKPVSAMGDFMDQKQKQIEKANFDLLMNELAFDLESFKVYRQKVVQCLSSRARKIQDWKGQVVQEAQQAAEHYMETYAASYSIGICFLANKCVTMCTFDDDDDGDGDGDGYDDVDNVVIVTCCGAEVTLKTWAPQDPGAAAITDLKKELSQRSRALQIPDDGSVPRQHWTKLSWCFLLGSCLGSNCRLWCP